MASILGTTWTIQRVTEIVPPSLQRGTVVEITLDATVKFGGKEWPGIHDADKNKVNVSPWEDEHWEFVASDEQEVGGEKFFVMYGCSWKMTKPDGMGAWVADPQGAP